MAAMAALIAFGLAFCSACQAQDDEALFAALVEGVDHRASLVTYVRGEADQQTFCSEACAREQAAWQGATDAGADDLPAVRTRGQYLVGMALGTEEWRYDVQPLVTPGGYANWGFSAPAGSGDLDGPLYYKRVTCTGGTCYEVVRSQRKPMARMTRPAFELPGPLQPPFGTWLGLSITWLRWSEHLTHSACRLLSVTETELDGVPCLRIAQAIERDTTIGVRLLWVAAGLGYAPLRNESMAVSKHARRDGARVVHEWHGYEEVGPSLFLPTVYSTDTYHYAGGSTDTWRCSRRIALNHLTLDPPDAATAAFLELIPTGALLSTPPSDRVPPTQDSSPAALLGRLQASVEPWARAKATVADDPVFCEADSRYWLPLQGTEITGMWAEYGP